MGRVEGQAESARQKAFASLTGDRRAGKLHGNRDRPARVGISIRARPRCRRRESWVHVSPAVLILAAAMPAATREAYDFGTRAPIKPAPGRGSGLRLWLAQSPNSTRSRSFLARTQYDSCRKTLSRTMDPGAHPLKSLPGSNGAIESAAHHRRPGGRRELRDLPTEERTGRLAPFFFLTAGAGTHVAGGGSPACHGAGRSW